MEFHFSKILKTIKEDLGIKNIEISIACCLSEATISNWQNSKSIPRDKDLKRLSKYFLSELESKIASSNLDTYLNKYIEHLEGIKLPTGEFENIINHKEKGKYHFKKKNNHYNIIFLILSFICKEDRKNRGTIQNKPIDKSISQLKMYNPKTSTGDGLLLKESKTTTLKNLTLLPIKPQDIIGRKDTFKDIDKLGDKVLLINGLGGIGKTELCRAYFWENYDNYHHVGWINYESGIKESIINQMKIGITFSEYENIDERYERILLHLSNLKSCLLVIDNISNCNDKNLNDISRFPFRVIATSRIKCGNFTSYNLGFMDQNSCKELFCKFFNNVSDEDIPYVEKIIKISGYHTLTIELLAKQCKCSALSVKELYELLEAKGLSLEGIKEKVAASIKNNLENKRLIEHLQKLFELFNLENDVERYILSNLSILPPLFVSKRDVKLWLVLEKLDELNSLIEKGWIIEEGDLIRLHEVISEVIRYSDIRPDMERCKKLIEHFGKFLKYDSLTGNPFEKGCYVIVGESILRYITANTEEIAALASNIAQIYEEQGYYNYSESLYKKALKIRKQVWGSNHQYTATSLNNLATLYIEQGSSYKATPLFKRSLKILKHLLNSNHLPDSKHLIEAEYYDSLGMLYYYQGKYDNAELLYKKSLKIKKQVLGDKHLATAISLHNLAVLYETQGKFDEAESLFISVLDIRGHALGDKHPSMAASLNNLATLYNRQRKYDKAEPLYKRTLKICKKLFDGKHPTTVISLNNLAELYKVQGEYYKAESSYKQAVDICGQSLGDKHPATAISLNNLATLYNIQSKYSEAEFLYNKAIELCEKSLGNNHPSIIAFLINLAELYKTHLKDDKAELLYKRIFEIRNQIVHKNLTPKEINEYLRREFPDYMVYININDKYAEPQTILEEKLVKVWGEVLNYIGFLGVKDNFFELGGQSIMVIQIASRINKELGENISILDIFKVPTIREMSAYMESLKYISTPTPIYKNEAKILYDLGLFIGESGTECVPNLETMVNRETGVTMLLRLFGEEYSALKLSEEETDVNLAKFTDASDVGKCSKKQVAYAIQQGYLDDYPNKMLYPKENLLGKDYCSFILLALGYKGDFDYDNAPYHLARIGGISQEQATAFSTDSGINLDAVVGISFSSLKARKKESGKTLLESHVELGIICAIKASKYNLLN